MDFCDLRFAVGDVCDAIMFGEIVLTNQRATVWRRADLQSFFCVCQLFPSSFSSMWAVFSDPCRITESPPAVPPSRYFRFLSEQ